MTFKVKITLGELFAPFLKLFFRFQWPPRHPNDNFKEQENLNKAKKVVKSHWWKFYALFERNVFNENVFCIVFQLNVWLKDAQLV